jgi:hypothetical protein
MKRLPTSYKLRMPAKLRVAVEQRAKKSGRSLNAELVELIEVALTAGDWDHLRDATKQLNETYRQQTVLIEQQRLLIERLRVLEASEEPG